MLSRLSSARGLQGQGRDQPACAWLQAQHPRLTRLLASIHSSVSAKGQWDMFAEMQIPLDLKAIEVPGGLLCAQAASSIFPDMAYSCYHFPWVPCSGKTGKCCLTPEHQAKPEVAGPQLGCWIHELVVPLAFFSPYPKGLALYGFIRHPLAHLSFG